MLKKTMLLLLTLLTLGCSTNVADHIQHPTIPDYLLYVGDKSLFKVLREGYKYRDGEWKSPTRLAREAEDKRFLDSLK